MIVLQEIGRNEDHLVNALPVGESKNLSRMQISRGL